MSDAALEAEIARLRDHVAALEAAQAKPATVNVEGFEGLRDLSRAIENKQLDGFLYERGVPDKVYFGLGHGRMASVFCISLYLQPLQASH